MVSGTKNAIFELPHITVSRVALLSQQMGTFDHVLSMVDTRDYGLWDHGRMIGGEKEIVIS